MRKGLPVVLAAAVLGLAYGGWRYMRPDAPQTSPPAPAADVITARQKPIVPEMIFVAKLEAPERVGLRARVTGFLQERLFQEGDAVRAGQLLFRIEPDNFEANVRQAQASLAKAQAALENATAQHERTATLFKTNDVSEARLDETKAARDSAAAAVRQTKAQLDLAQKDLEYTEIVAPIAGKIGESVFSVGELLGPTSGVLAEVVSMDPMDAVFAVSENQLLLLQDILKTPANAQVSLITSNGKTYPRAGALNFVDVTLDETMNTLKMKASFPNPQEHLISGQYGRVALKSAVPLTALTVPLRAVQRDQAGAFVYIVAEGNVLEKRAVQTGLELPDFEVVIEEGLNDGDTVVVSGFQRIAPGMPVAPQPPAESAP